MDASGQDPRQHALEGQAYGGMAEVEAPVDPAAQLEKGGQDGQELDGPPHHHRDGKDVDRPFGNPPALGTQEQAPKAEGNEGQVVEGRNGSRQGEPSPQVQHSRHPGRETHQRQVREHDARQSGRQGHIRRQQPLPRQHLPEEVQLTGEGQIGCQTAQHLERRDRGHEQHPQRAKHQQDDAQGPHELPHEVLSRGLPFPGLDLAQGRQEGGRHGPLRREPAQHVRQPIGDHERIHGAPEAQKMGEDALSDHPREAGDKSHQPHDACGAQEGWRLGCAGRGFRSSGGVFRRHCVPSAVAPPL